MTKHITPGQIKELLTIDEKQGCRAEVQELIARLTLGGTTPAFEELRVMQAKRLHDKNFGTALGMPSFDVYLATIPEIPQWIKKRVKKFPLIVLVDTRLELAKIAELLGYKPSSTDRVPGAHKTTRVRTEKVYWICCRDHRKDCITVSQVSHKCVEDEFDLSEYESLAFLAQYPG